MFGIDFDLLGRASLVGWLCGGIVGNIITIIVYLWWRSVK